MANFILYLTEVVNGFGYFGVFVAVMLEYACFPISSEILLPFLGYSAFVGNKIVALSIIFATAGAVVGCSFCYGVGRFGTGLIERFFCKKSVSIRKGIKGSKKYFNEFGNQSVCIGRLIPILRTYISFPAGMGKMDYKTFVKYSFLGALIWNTVLISIGYMLGSKWEYIGIFFGNHKFFIILISIVAIIFIIRKRK